MYEYFEHTADVGIRLEGHDLPSVLSDAGRAFFGLIVENLDAVRPEESVQIVVPADPRPENLDYLLFDWLSALLREFETTGRVFSELDVEVSADGITAICRGERLDPTRHRLGHEIKAVTYHQLELKPTASGYSGRVILDV